jgi:hypothetical protein
MLQLARTKVQLTPAEHAQLRAAVERDAQEFAHRVANPLEVDQIEQPWFRRHRVLDVQSAVPFPARRIHVVASGTDMHVLTAHLEHLQRTAASDPPLDLADEDSAAAYAASGNAWTRVHALGELQVASFDEIPWYANLDGAQRKTIDELAARWGHAIGPEERRRGPDGWVFHSWWVAMRKLIERELVVPQGGQLRRVDQVRAEELPVPPGSHWGMVNGRLVPIG